MGTRTLELKINQYKRIITFGCSWTKYDWPTWANVISEILDLPLVNQGTAGIGNVAILHKMLAWDIEHGFDDTDLVLVNWSTWSREDRIKNGGWKTGGNIFNSKFYNAKFIREYWDDENDFVKNAGAIIMAGRLFNIAYQSRMPYENTTAKFHHKNWLSNLSHIEDFANDNYQNQEWRNLTSDVHPSILPHTYHAIKIAKLFGFKDTDKLDKVKEAYEQLHDNIFNDLLKIGPKKISKDKNRTIVPRAVKLNLKKLSRPVDFQCHTGKETWHGLYD